MATIKPSFQDRLAAQASDLESGKIYIVGVVIFRLNPNPNSPSKHQLLIVKRASHEESFPNMWEIPGGHVEPGETIRQCIERETFEETGLLVESVLREFAEMVWESRSSGQKKNVQLNFAVTVREQDGLRVNLEEHSEWMWVEEGMVEGLPMTAAMNKVVRDSLKLSRIDGVL